MEPDRYYFSDAQLAMNYGCTREKLGHIVKIGTEALGKFTLFYVDVTKPARPNRKERGADL